MTDGRPESNARRWCSTVAGALLMVAFALAGSGAAVASHHGRAADDTPGHFDYYLLSLSWSPAYCLDAPVSAQCNGTRAYGFIVHGLWPQNDRGWPSRCARSRVPDEVVTSMLDLMPARGLIHHEWSEHGTCSGLEPEQYFRLVRTARSTISIPAGFGIAGPIEQQPSSLVQAFLRANPRLIPESIIVACSGGNVARLKEVRVCLSRDLAPRRCGAEVARGSCRAETLLVQPVR